MGDREEQEIRPHYNDILMGRGGKNNQHVGNEQLRTLARSQRDTYRFSSKKGKSHISREIVAYVRRMSPPGRFLKKDALTGLWEDVGDDVAREKVSQVLRDAVSSLHDESEHGPQSDRAATSAQQESMDEYSNDHRRCESAPTIVMQPPRRRRRDRDGRDNDSHDSQRSYSPSRVAYIPNPPPARHPGHPAYHHHHQYNQYSPPEASAMAPAPPDYNYSPTEVSSMPPNDSTKSENIPLSPIRSSAAKKQKRAQAYAASAKSSGGESNSSGLRSGLLDDLSTDMCEDIDLFDGDLLNDDRRGVGGGGGGVGSGDRYNQGYNRSF